MNPTRKLGLAALLSLATAGCQHKKTTALAPAQAPSIAVSKTTAPPAGNPLSTQSPPPLPSLPPATEDASKHAPKPPPRVHHLRRKPKPDPAAADTAATTPTAAGAVTPPAATPGPPGAAPAPAPSVTLQQTAEVATPPANVSAIGLLSTGDMSTGAQSRRASVADLITSTETGLSKITRSLGTVDQQTANQIRSFLQKAKTALDDNDLDGANTLATKAKVLLDELTKE